jgi:transcription elongation GreA/GreB family factor
LKANNFKQSVIETCKHLLQQRAFTAEQAMNAAQEAANGEDKSSAGDKYETSRAMGQLDRNMNAKQLAEVQKELAELERLEKNPPKTDMVYSGSLIKTSMGYLYIAVGLGKQEIENQNVVLLSKNSPLALALLGKKAKEQIAFNGNKISVEEIL